MKHFIVEAYLKHRMIWGKSVPVEPVVVAGVVVGILAASAANVYYGAAAALVSVAVAWIVLPRRKAVALGVALILGCGSVGVHQVLAPRTLTRETFGDFRLRITDRRLTSVRGVTPPKMVTAELKEQRLNGEAMFVPVRRRVAVLFPAGGDFPKFGEEFYVRGNLAPVPEDGFGKYLASRSCHGVLRIERAARIAAAEGFSAAVCRLRDGLLRRTLSGIASQEVRDRASGLFFGVGAGISGESRRQFLLSGTIHLFSISGMHVAMLAGALFLLLRPLRNSWRTAVLLAVLTLYVFTTGAASPALRAWGMIVVWCVLRLFLLRTPPIRILALAAAILLLVNPALLYDLGFLYSFLITAALLLVVRRIREWSVFSEERFALMGRGSFKFQAQRSTKRYERLLFALLGCVTAFLAGAAISLRSNGLLLPGSIAANIVLLPLLPILFFLLGIKIFFGWIWRGIDLLAAQALSWGFGFLDSVTGIAAQLFENLPAVRPALWEILFFYAGLLLLFLWRSSRTAVLGGCLVGACLIAWPIRAAHQSAALWVGVGADRVPMAVVYDPLGDVTVVDAPAPETVRLAAEFLRERGTVEVDCLRFSRLRRGVMRGVGTLERELAVRRMEIPPEDRFGKAALAELKHDSLLFAALSAGPLTLQEQEGTLCFHYSNPAAQLEFDLGLTQLDSGWLLRLERAGKSVETLLPYGNKTECWRWSFEHGID